MWLPWDEVLKVAGTSDLPTVPVAFRGQVSSPAALRGILEEASRRPSALCVTGPPEGFVVRPSGGFRNQDFADCVSKYVLEDFVQVQNFSSKTWRKANVLTGSRVDPCHQAAYRQPCSPSEDTRRPRNDDDDDDDDGDDEGDGDGDGDDDDDDGASQYTGMATAAPVNDEAEMMDSDVPNHRSVQAPVADAMSPRKLLPVLPETGTPLSHLVRQMRGPTCNSNWVIPGMVMAGNRSSVDKNLKELIAEGITTFVSLQQKGDTPGGSYRKRVLQAFPEARFRTFPILDQNITEDSRVNALVQVKSLQQ